MITGDNFQDGIVRGNGSYYFSKLTHVWGWATWKELGIIMMLKCLFDQNLNTQTNLIKYLRLR